MQLALENHMTPTLKSSKSTLSKEPGAKEAQANSDPNHQMDFGKPKAKSPLKSDKYTSRELTITPIRDNYPVGGSIDAGTLLIWCKKTDISGLKITSEIAQKLLEIFPPVICQEGDLIWVAGDVKQSAYLLSHLPPSTKVAIRSLPARHPFALINLPLHQLIAEGKRHEKPSLIKSLAKALRLKRQPTHSEIGTVMNIDQSAVTRMIAKAEGPDK
jgi:hypothetical protein